MSPLGTPRPPLQGDGAATVRGCHPPARRGSPGAPGTLGRISSGHRAPVHPPPSGPPPTPAPTVPRRWPRVPGRRRGGLRRLPGPSPSRGRSGAAGREPGRGGARRRRRRGSAHRRQRQRREAAAAPRTGRAPGPSRSPAAAAAAAALWSRRPQPEPRAPSPVTGAAEGAGAAPPPVARRGGERGRGGGARGRRHREAEEEGSAPAPAETRAPGGGRRRRRRTEGAAAPGTGSGEVPAGCPHPAPRRHRAGMQRAPAPRPGSERDGVGPAEVRRGRDGSGPVPAAASRRSRSAPREPRGCPRHPQTTRHRRSPNTPGPDIPSPPPSPLHPPPVSGSCHLLPSPALPPPLPPALLQQGLASCARTVLPLAGNATSRFPRKGDPAPPKTLPLPLRQSNGAAPATRNRDGVWFRSPSVPLPSFLPAWFGPLALLFCPPPLQLPGTLCPCCGPFTGHTGCALCRLGPLCRAEARGTAVLSLSSAAAPALAHLSAPPLCFLPHCDNNNPDGCLRASLPAPMGAAGCCVQHPLGTALKVTELSAYLQPSAVPR